MSKRQKSKKFQMVETQERSEKLIQEQSSQTDRSTRSTSSPSKSIDKSNKKNGKEKQKKKFSWPIYRKLLSYSRKRWPFALSSLVFNMLSAFALSLIPWKIGNVLDIVTNAMEDPGLEGEFHHQIHLLLALILGTSIIHVCRFLSTQMIQEQLLLDMRTDIFEKFINFDLRFFEQYKTGELISRLGNDINQAKSAISNNLTFLIRNFITILANIVILFIISWKLTLLILMVVPLYGAFTLLYTSKSKVITKEYQDIMAEMSSQTSQKFTGIQVVKAFSTEKYESKKYAEVNQKAYKCALRRTMWWAMENISGQLLPNAGTLIVLWYGGQQIINGTGGHTPGQLTSFMLYCAALSANISSISQSYSNIINGTHAVQKVFQMLEYKCDVEEDQGPNQQIEGDVQFKNVTFKYPKAEAPVLQNFELEIKKGEYVAIVGQSGSGKTTLVKLIERFYKLTDGQIYFSKHDSGMMNIKHLRGQIGLVSQQPMLFSGTVEENITYGLEDYTHEELEAAAEKSGCMEFISNNRMFPLAFKTQIGERGAQLSGGQKQRVSIARALMRKPKILIFDQATSALDTNSEAMVQKSIQTLSQDQNKMTIIVIAHRLSTVINAERILVMKQGQILEEGTHSSLKSKKGYYYELVQKQLTGENGN